MPDKSLILKQSSKLRKRNAFEQAKAKLQEIERIASAANGVAAECDSAQGQKGRRREISAKICIIGNGIGQILHHSQDEDKTMLEKEMQSV